MSRRHTGGQFKLTLRQPETHPEWLATGGNFKCSKHPMSCGVRRAVVRHEVLRLSYPVYFEAAFSSARAWSIWSYAYVAMAAVVIVSPLRASDS
jgi:hypothetical protein